MKKIIVAEDDKFIGSAYRLKLAKAGFDIRLAEDGDAVISILKEGFVPDLILLDLVMPNKDGFATLKELKENPAWKNIPVIIASNLGQKEDVEKGLSMGAIGYIVKTDMTMEKILEKIKSVV